MKIKTINVVYKSGTINLVGVLFIPDGSGPFPGVIMCHPHSANGGSMDNWVVGSVCSNLVSQSIAALKFNFRGVGGSQGTFDNGIGESDDVRAAIEYFVKLSEVDNTRIGLAGYSAGTVWGFPVGCLDDRIKALAAVSPAFSMSDFNFLTSCRKPKYLITGDRDTHVPLDKFNSLCEHLPEPKKYVVVKGVTHFWTHGSEEIAGKGVADFFKSYL